MDHALHILSLFAIGLLVMGAYTFREKGIKKGTGILFAGCLLLGVPKLYFIIQVMSPTGIDIRAYEYLNLAIYLGTMVTSIGVFWIARYGVSSAISKAKEGSNQSAQDNPVTPTENPRIN